MINYWNFHQKNNSVQRLLEPRVWSADAWLIFNNINQKFFKKKKLCTTFLIIWTIQALSSITSNWITRWLETKIWILISVFHGVITLLCWEVSAFLTAEVTFFSLFCKCPTFLLTRETAVSGGVSLALRGSTAFGAHLRNRHLQRSFN